MAHNASFDMGFLNHGFKKIGLEKADNPVIDTLEVRPLFISGIEESSLKFVM